jgi:hypothetical protein
MNVAVQASLWKTSDYCSMDLILPVTIDQRVSNIKQRDTGNAALNNNKKHAPDITTMCYAKREKSPKKLGETH